MIDPSMVPTLDPNPLPAPYWLFKLLLLVTFFLHIVAMNFMLGGAVLAVFARFTSKGKEFRNRIFLDLAKKIPVFLAATITIGIAPLLFVQAIYGQYFYTSTILIAWPWFLLLVLLVVAYYGFYYVAYNGKRRPGPAGIVLLVSLALVLIVGFIQSTNVTLMQNPTHWAAKYFASPTGWSNNLSDPTLIPRYLHFVTSAISVGGILLVLLALVRWDDDRDYASYLFQYGGKAFMYATMAQFIIGSWFLISIPRNFRMLFMGDNPLASALFIVGILGTVGAIFLMSDALRKQNIRMAAYGVSGILAVVILTMILMRDILRDAYLEPYFHPHQFAVKTQWAVLPVFLVLFLGGVGLWLLMLQRYGLFASKLPPSDLGPSIDAPAEPEPEVELVG
jgi:drug/metabolite transporter (DMT)-like permease